MIPRIYRYNKKFQRFDNPSMYYGRVFRNPKANARIRKKASDTINDFNVANESGWSIMQAAMRGDLTFKQWHAHFSEKVSNRNCGVNRRWWYPNCLKTSFRIYIDEVKAVHHD